MPHKKLFIGLISALALILVALVIYNFSGPDKLAVAPEQKDIKKEEAPKGELVADFPKELAQGQGTVNESYAIPYDGAKQYTTNLSSDKSVAEVAKGYSDYFSANGFVAIKQTVVNSEISTVFALKDSTTYSVFIAKPEGATKTSVTISVVKQ